MKVLLQAFLIVFSISLCAPAQTFHAGVTPNGVFTAAPASPTAVINRSFFSEIKLNGSQTDGAVCESNKNSCAANTFVLSGFSTPFAVVVTVSVEHDGVVGIKGDTIPARGTWMMVVSKAGKYVGTLFGDVRDGKAAWSQDMFSGVKLGRTAQAELRILGGFDGYAQVEANDVPTLAFSSFTRISGEVTYTEASLAKVF
jgi:hypothetical protein